MSFKTRYFLKLLFSILHIKGYTGLTFHNFKSHFTSKTSLNSVSTRQNVAIDGGEYLSLQSFYCGEDVTNISYESNGDLVKFIPFAVGMGLFDGETSRIVGIVDSTAKSANDDVVQLDKGTFLIKASVAKIPESIRDRDAISTAMASLVGVHCCIPQINSIGGSVGTNEYIKGKVAVIGGGDYARFVAKAMEALGTDVTLVSTVDPKVKNRNVNKITPSVGEFDVGFAEHLGSFDSLLDTLYDERDVGYGKGLVGSGVVEGLKRRHSCERYASTFSHTQKIINDAGIFFGPNQAKEYVQRLVSRGSSITTFPEKIPVPDDFGAFTLQKIFDQGIIFNAVKCENGVMYRDWSLRDFWEHTAWPRDVSEEENIRYGFSVVNDKLSEEEESFDLQTRKEKVLIEEKQENPYVTEIYDINGFEDEILSSENNYVLFLSAPHCRACFAMDPQYTRMARLAQQNKHQLVFAKANAASKKGKMLGKALDIDSVPTFVMFRAGELFGVPMSIAKLPSEKLERAIDSLTSGMKWDSKVILGKN